MAVFAAKTGILKIPLLQKMRQSSNRLICFCVWWNVWVDFVEFGGAWGRVFSTPPKKLKPEIASFLQFRVTPRFRKKTSTRKLVTKKNLKVEIRRVRWLLLGLKLFKILYSSFGWNRLNQKNGVGKLRKKRSTFESLKNF